MKIIEKRLKAINEIKNLQKYKSKFTCAKRFVSIGLIQHK